MKKNNNNFIFILVPILISFLCMSLLFISCPPPSGNGGNGNGEPEPPEKGEDGKITINLSNALDATDCVVYFDVLNNGDIWLTNAAVAWGEATIDSTGNASATAEDGGGEVTFTGDSVFDIYFWIDMNGNYDATDIPETSIDMVAEYQNLTIDGDQTINLNYQTDFELLELFPSQVNFNAQNVQTNDWYVVPSTLRYIGTYCVIYVEDASLGIVDTTLAQSIGQEFDNNVYDLVRANFALEMDVNGDERVTILILDILDGWAGAGGYVAGYFQPINQFSKTTYAESNEQEMIYMDCMPGTAGGTTFNITMAHEFQHLVNFCQNYFVEAPPDMQDTWINEGLSSAAEYLYNGGHIQAKIDYYNADNNDYIAKGMNFVTWWREYECYCTVYLFFQWLRIQDSDHAAIYKQIMDDPDEDFSCVETVCTDVATPWKTLLRSWYIANVFDDPAGLYGYEDEINVSMPVLAESGVQWQLYAGEGVVVNIAASTAMGDGTFIDYAGLNTTTSAIDLTSSYDGDKLLCYHESGDPNDADELTDTLPALVLNPNILAPNIYNIDIPANLPIDVVFGLDGKGTNTFKKKLPQRRYKK